MTGPGNVQYWVRRADLERDGLTRLVVFMEVDQDHMHNVIFPREMEVWVRKYSRKVTPTHTRTGEIST